MEYTLFVGSDLKITELYGVVASILTYAGAPFESRPRDQTGCPSLIYYTFLFFCYIWTRRTGIAQSV
jgi:hypothetical protein